MRYGPCRGDAVRTAVVTGGGSGIGLAVVERLRKDGLQVASLDLKPADGPSAFTADVTHSFSRPLNPLCIRMKE